MSKIQWVGEVVPPVQPTARPADAGTVTYETDRIKITLGGPKLFQLGAPADDQSTDWGMLWSVLSVVGMGLSAYHGYARNKSVGWGIGWGVAGAIAPIITVPIAVAQGFGKPASGARANPAEPFSEVGRFEHEGKVYEAGGAYYDREHGILVGYPGIVVDETTQARQHGQYVLARFDGTPIVPLRLVKKYRGGFGRSTMWAWSAVYDGRVFSGRNLGPHMILRMRAGRSAK